MYFRILSLLIQISMALLALYAIFSLINVLRGFKKIPEPHVMDELDERRHLSIIIPARNEEGNIGRCIRSVLRLLRSSDELLIVDDGSSDGTFEEAVANCDDRCSIIKILNKPKDWTGKNWSCYNGYLYSSGEFLIFLDADTILNGGVREIYSLLKMYDAVSQIPRIRCETIACGAVEIAFTSILRLVYPYWDVKGMKAWLAGAFMGWRRRSYELVGTHLAVRDSPVEDVSLGRLAAKKGLKISFFRGYFAESTWISRWTEAINTLARISRAGAPRPLYAYILLTAFIYISLLTYLSLPMALTGLIDPTLCLVYLTSIFGYSSISFKEVEANPISIIFAPIGLIIVGISLVKASRGNGVEWKEREIK